MTPEAREQICSFYGIENIYDVLEVDDLHDSTVEGFCTNCGYPYGIVEPDASGYHCDGCGLDKVESIVNIIL